MVDGIACGRLAHAVSIVNRELDKLPRVRLLPISSAAKPPLTRLIILDVFESVPSV